MKAILLFSGGLDSTTVLYLLRSSGWDVECLSIDYGQSHRKELEAAKKIASLAGVECHRVALPHIWQNCALVGAKPIPVGDDEGNIVSNRNMVMLAIATTFAIEHGASAVAWGPNKDDWGTFPDCRRKFADAMRAVMACCHTEPVTLKVPLIGKTKGEIAQMAKSLGVPINETWSCYNGGDLACGFCGACEARENALQSISTNAEADPVPGT